MNRPSWKRVAAIAATWALTLFMAFVFTVQGFAKFSATSGWAVAFRHWGYPDWFRMGIGVAELLAAALLLIPPVAPFGAGLIIMLMLGGIGTHAAAGDRQVFQSELGPILFATVLMLLRRKELARYRP